MEIFGNNTQFNAIGSAIVATNFSQKNDLLNYAVCPLIKSGATGAKDLIHQAYEASLKINSKIGRTNFSSQKELDGLIYSVNTCESYVENVPKDTMDIANEMTGDYLNKNNRWMNWKILLIIVMIIIQIIESRSVFNLEYDLMRSSPKENKIQSKEKEQ